MDIDSKLSVLADAAKYDVSCSSSGSDRASSGSGFGAAMSCGVCHSWADDGRCISLLKVLLSNVCIYDCAYCVNRRSNDVRRATFTPEELVNLTINFYKRNYIEGLFLSSAVFKNPDHTMEQMLRVVKQLRTVEGYHGYIHMKAIPGASPALIREAGMFVDRMSINIELPSETGLKLLAPEKNRKDILQPMSFIGENYRAMQEERQKHPKAPRFVPAGQSTQLIVGATPDSDFNIIRLSESLYRKFSLKRVYYSAYMHVNNDKRLPALTVPPLLREHRLYQADWLIRKYGFSSEEILDESSPQLDTAVDPKAHWALRNRHLFPVEINTADREMLLRIPGVGPLSVRRILQARRFAPLSFEQLGKMGVVLKRARYFITCGGKSLEPQALDSLSLRERLSLGEKRNKESEQLLLFG